MSLLERYQSGECDLVWRELIELGDEINSEPCFSEACAVADEVVRRVICNLEKVRRFFIDEGFEFQDENVITPAGDSTRLGVQAIERELGSIPLILKTWWQQIDSVDFSQSNEQYRSGIGPQCDGIVPIDSLSILSPKRALELSKKQAREIEEHNAEIALAMDNHPDLRDSLHCTEIDKGFLPLGPCASNCELKGFSLPCSHIDDRYYNDGGGDTHFVQDLRRAFGHAGVAFVFYGPLPPRDNGSRRLMAKTSRERQHEILDTFAARLIAV